MSLLPGPLDDLPVPEGISGFTLHDGMVVIRQFFVGGVRAKDEDDDEEHFAALSPLRYTYREAAEDGRRIDPEGRNSAVFSVLRSFDPSAVELLDEHLARAARARGGAQ